jgi:hypothetical protein
MDRVLTLTTFEQDEQENAALEYWLTRSPEERLAEVERLRQDYIVNLRGAERHGCPQGLRGSLLLVEREES